MKRKAMKRKAMERKWKDNRGETLIEVLASILVGSLSIAMLFSAVMASIQMDKTAKEADADFTASLNLAEEQETPAGITGISAGGEGIVTVKNESAPTSTNLTVVFYGDEKLLSYKLK